MSGVGNHPTFTLRRNHMTGQWITNGLHHSTPWWGVLIYRMLVLGTLAITAWHQITVHASCVTLPPLAP